MSREVEKVSIGVLSGWDEIDSSRGDRPSIPVSDVVHPLHLCIDCIRRVEGQLANGGCDFSRQEVKGLAVGRFFWGHRVIAGRQNRGVAALSRAAVKPKSDLSRREIFVAPEVNPFAIVRKTG